MPMYGGPHCQDKIGPILRKIETFERVPRCYRLSTPCTAKCAEFDWSLWIIYFLFLMVRSFLDAIFTFVVLIRRWLTHSQERQEQLFHRKTPLFSESTKSFLCGNSGFSLDFTMPKIGGEWTLFSWNFTALFGIKWGIQFILCPKKWVNREL